MLDLIGLRLEDAIELLEGKQYRVVHADNNDGKNIKLVVAVRQIGDTIEFVVSEFKINAGADI